MTDRPIIFSRPMVRALLAGRKTQTRRLVRGIPPKPAMDNLKHEPRHAEPYLDSYCSERKTAANPRGMSRDWAWWTRDDRPGVTFKVPAVPGDRLYVREAYLVSGVYTDVVEVRYQASKRSSYTEFVEQVPIMQASGAKVTFPRYRPSIHMPRWASRLTLIVEDVRIERLQAISTADVLAEGAPIDPNHRDTTQDSSNPVMCVGDRPWVNQSPRAWYHRLWDSRHGEGDWESDPFVVALTFRVEHSNIDRIAS